MIYDLEDRCKISEHQLAGDGKDDDAEELTDDIQRRGAEVLRQPVRADQHQVEHQHTKQQSDAEVAGGILRRDRQQRRESTRARVHRESQRHDSTAGTDLALELVVLEDRDIQHHLQRHQEDHKTSGDSEILNLHAEELEHPFAQKEEGHQDDQTGDTDLAGMDPDTPFLHRDGDRNITERIDDSYQENKRG